MSATMENVWDGDTYVYHGGKVSRKDKRRITRVQVADSVSVIQFQAFERCRLLEYVGLTDDVIEIRPRAFCECAELTTVVNLSSAKPESTKEDEGGKVPVPSESHRRPFKIHTIGKKAFFRCKKLTIDLEFSMPVHEIGKDSFYECAALTGVKFHKTVKRIGTFAFCSCRNIKSVEFTNDDDDDDDDVDDGSSSSDAKNLILGEYAFYGCQEMKSLMMRKQPIKRIPRKCFGNSPKLHTLELSAGLEYIDQGSFYKCTSLKSIGFPDTVKRIGPTAFEVCCSLAEVKLPPSIECIERSTFSHCSSLRRIELPNSLKTIEKFAFNHCASLTEITVAHPHDHGGAMPVLLPSHTGSSSKTDEQTKAKFVLPHGIQEIGLDAFNKCHETLGKIIDDKLVHHYCDLNRGGRRYLQGTKRPDAALWPRVLHRILYSMELPKGCSWSKSGDALPNEETRRFNVVFTLLVQDGTLWTEQVTRPYVQQH